MTPWLGFAPNPDGTGGQDRAFNWFTDTYMERDPAGELAGGLNLYQGFGGDPINNVDPSGDSPRQNDSLAALPGHRSYSQIEAEAKAQVNATYPTTVNASPNTVVIHHSLWTNTTYQNLIDSVASDKETWYLDRGFIVESDQPYAQDLAIYQQPPTISADTRSAGQKALDIDSAQTELNPIYPPNEAAQLLRSHNGSLIGALGGALASRGPIIVAGIAGLTSPAGGSVMMGGRCSRRAIRWPA